MATTTTLGPGVYEDAPIEEYLSWPYCSHGRLVGLRDRSPAHVRHEMENPRPSTPAQEMGTAVHTAVLEPNTFRERYLRGPDGPWNRNPWKAEVTQLREANPEAIVLKADAFDTCLRIRDLVVAHPVAKQLIDGRTELSAVWEDPATGVLCRGRFDVLNERIAVVVDLKKTRDASRDAFSRAIYAYGYHMQAAFYLRGAQALGFDFQDFAILAVEDEPPNCIAVYELEPAALAYGEAEIEPLIPIYAECDRTGVWPGYPEEPVRVGLPTWAEKKIDGGAK